MCWMNLNAFIWNQLNYVTSNNYSKKMTLTMDNLWLEEELYDRSTSRSKGFRLDDWIGRLNIKRDKKDDPNYSLDITKMLLGKDEEWWGDCTEIVSSIGKRRSQISLGRSQQTSFLRFKRLSWFLFYTFFFSSWICISIP